MLSSSMICMLVMETLPYFWLRAASNRSDTLPKFTTSHTAFR